MDDGDGITLLCSALHCSSMNHYTYHDMYVRTTDPWFAELCPGVRSISIGKRLRFRRYGTVDIYLGMYSTWVVDDERAPQRPATSAHNYLGVHM